MHYVAVDIVHRTYLGKVKNGSLRITSTHAACGVNRQDVESDIWEFNVYPHSIDFKSSVQGRQQGSRPGL